MRRIFLIASVSVLTICAKAQRIEATAHSNDIAVTAGGYFAGNTPLNLGAAWALEGTFAHRLASLPLIGLYAELPVAGSFNSSIPTFNGQSVARSYNSLFITPGLRLKLAPSFFLSPYVSGGLGYARFSRHLANGTTTPNSSFAFDVGGGLDWKIAPFLSLRGELRDFNSGGLGLETSLLGRQNNLFATLGLVIRF